MKYPEVKKYFDEYNAFNSDDWLEFEDSLCGKSVKKGEYLLEEGKVCREMTFIVKGCFRYFYVKDGREITISFFVENEFVSALPSFLTQTRSEQIIDAIEDSVIITISYEDLQNSYERFPKFEKTTRMIIQKLLVSAQNRLADYLLMTPEERYVKFLNESPQLLQRIPQYYIASYLGITPVSLSRIRKRIFSK